MSTATLLREDMVEAAGRATIYSLLAAGIAMPTSERLTLIRTILVPGAVALDLPEPIDTMVAHLADVVPNSPEEVRDHHMVLFPPIVSRDAPGYETAYRGDDIFQQSTFLADIAGFYRAHGLRAGGRERERLDHIIVELEFMAVLARKQAMSLVEGRVDDASVCQETASTFLRDHLGCWGPSFGRRASAVTTSVWYRSICQLLASWIEVDIEMAGVTPAEVADEPLPQEPPDDGLCGPCPMPGGELRR